MDEKLLAVCKTWKPNATTGDILHPAMTVQDEETAAAYLEEMVQHMCTNHGKTQEQARAICLQNIGYWTGYYDNETASRVLRLFGTVHPIFGAKQPSPEEAFTAGMKAALK